MNQLGYTQFSCVYLLISINNLSIKHIRLKYPKMNICYEHPQLGVLSIFCGLRDVSIHRVSTQRLVCIHQLLVNHVSAHLRVYSLAINAACVHTTVCRLNGELDQRLLVYPLTIDVACASTSLCVFLVTIIVACVDATACRWIGAISKLSMITHFRPKASSFGFQPNQSCRPNGVTMHQRVDSKACVYPLAIGVTCVSRSACGFISYACGMCRPNGVSMQRSLKNCVDTKVCRSNGSSLLRRVYPSAVDTSACLCIGCRYIGVSMHRWIV